MKKYTILDSSGQKKIVYAPDMKKALRYIGDGEKTIKDSKVGDSTVSIWWSPHRQYGLDYFIKKYGLNIHTHVPYPATSPNSGIDYVAKGKKEDLITLLTKIKRTELISEIKDSKVKDEDDYFYFDADEDDRSLDDYKRIMKQCGLTITKVEGNNREAFIYYRGSSSAEQKAAKMLGISLDDSIKDSKVNDAGLKTYKTLEYYAENGYYKVYVKNRNKNGDQPIKHLAETLGLKTSPQGYFTKDRVYAPPYAKEYLVEGTNKDAIIKFCETLDPKLVPLKGHIKDADANIVGKLISEEEKAVMDYKEALMADSDLSANAVYAHILAEELEHLKELRSLREQPSLGDSIKDAEWKRDENSGLDYKFEQGYWYIRLLYNTNRLTDDEVYALAKKLNVTVEPYNKASWNRLDRGIVHRNYTVKGKDKENVAKFCDRLDDATWRLKFE